MKRNPTLPGRRLRLSLALLALLSACAVLAPSAAAGTVVSLTFDDGSAGQYQVRAPLAQRGMRATFFVNSNTIGTFGTGSQARMSWQQVADLAADGNEIGGHTLDHADLTALNTTQATRQVCDDRQALQARGYAPVSFAYPFGTYNPTVKQIAANCGYTSARAFNEGNPPRQGIETLPPADRFATKTVISANSTTTLATLQSHVLQAEANPAGNGWVQYVFHRVCGPGCDVFDAVQLNTLTAFLDWLAPRAASGTVVRTVRAALDQGAPPPPPPDTTAPTSTIACNGVPCAATPYSSPVSVSLAAGDSGGSGVQAIRYTTDGSTPTATSPTYSAPFTVSQTTTVRYRAWDNAGNAEPVNSRQIQIAEAPPPPPPSGQTVVSLTFDDGSAGQYQVRAPLAQRGMRATFFVNSNTIGTFGTGSQARMSWQQVADLAADGNEIGGHTLDHADLTALNTTQATRQVCDDRQALQARGYAPVSFAYPFGTYNPTVKQIAANCGYTSARAFNEGNPPRQGIETLPPADRFATKTVIAPNSLTTLSTLQSYVLQAEASNGGWVQYVFHRVCGPGCDVFDAIQLDTLVDFLDWLAPRADDGTVVRTVRSALGG